MGEWRTVRGTWYVGTLGGSVVGLIERSRVSVFDGEGPSAELPGAANAWHHRSDALSSIGTAAGIGGAIFLGQRWTVLDPIASVVVGAFIVKVAVDLLRNGIGDLMEQSLPDAVEEEMLRIVGALPGVVNPHDLRTRRIGNHYAIELHILMDGDISLREAHNKASEVEDLLRARYGEDTHVAVHVEPKEIISQNLNNQP